MFPRIALLLCGALVGALLSTIVGMSLASDQNRHRKLVLNTGVRLPYQNLLRHMHNLAEQGRYDELAVVIRRAHNGHSEISRVWLYDDENAFRRHVDDLVR